MVKNSVCCIIIVYNIGDRLYKCFNSVYNQVDEVVLVDNGSTTETLEVLDELAKRDRVKVIYNGENKGIAYALNVGVKYAESKVYNWVLTMDNDSIASNNMVQAMINSYDLIEDDIAENIIGMFPKRIDMAINNIRDIESNIESSYEFLNVDMTSGNLMKLKIFKEIGYFDEKLFIDLVDTDYCFRIVENGYKMIYFNEIYLLHSLGKVKKRKIIVKNITYTNHSPVRRYYMTRNRLYVWNKYKNIARYEILRDKYWALSETIKIIIFEEEKLLKLKMIYKAICDYRNNIFGAYKNNV